VVGVHRRPQQRVCAHLIGCRTEALGGLGGRCDRCGAEQPRYRSCGDRHCPQCQGRATEAWSERQSANQLPVPYFHRVFTLPHRLNPWVQSHPEVIYRALFHAAWGTLDAFGHDPKRQGGQLGMTGVLHTWGQSLCQHVHLHCLVPGGALADDGTWLPEEKDLNSMMSNKTEKKIFYTFIPPRELRYRNAAGIPVKGSYLFPVRALSRHFRGRFVSALRSAAQAGELTGIDPGAVSALLDALMAEEWVVFAEPCLEHTASLIGYLARYTHRIAISNARILGVDGDQVHVSYRDYRDGEHKTLVLQAAELLRRFLLHVLPKGLMRARHYGLLANRCRVQRLAQICQLLAAPAPEPEPESEAEQGHEPELGWPCSVCRRGRMRPVRRIAPRRAALGCAPYR